MKKCPRCGMEWEDWAVARWTHEQRAKFAKGEGCPDCIDLSDEEAKDRYEKNRKLSGDSASTSKRKPVSMGVSAIIGGVGAIIWPLIFTPRSSAFPEWSGLWVVIWGILCVGAIIVGIMGLSGEEDKGLAATGLILGSISLVWLVVSFRIASWVIGP